ncbi:hypothetical protein DFJ77DRAFT_470736 [Powellomyces hirtus]|nr:hypothetical protein DFJ77DRAFT_470736 [Powellomyces hirtus]
MASGKYTLFGGLGCGSAVVEAVLELLGEPYEYTAIDWKVMKAGGTSDAISRLAQHNPLKQVPTFITREGVTMTESAAIVLHLLDTHAATANDMGLRPQDAKTAAQFLNWMMFVPVNIYAVLTLNDFPHRWLPDTADQKLIDAFGEKVDQRLWGNFKIMNDAVVGPYFLGEEMTALDVYLAMVTQWIRKGDGDLFREKNPKLFQAIVKTEEHPVVNRVWTKNTFVPGRGGAQ